MIGRRHLGPRLRPALRSPTAALFALYASAAVVATLPAVLRFRSAFIAQGASGHGEAAYGDHLQSVYRFWLVGHQLGRGAAPWLDPYSFQPLVPPQPNLGGWPFGLAFWPLDALFGPVVAWNLLLLAGIVAAGLLTAAWLRALGVPPAATALGGLAFAIAPYRLLQSGGHLLGWGAIMLPLALWSLERARTAATRRAAHTFGAVTAAALVSLPLGGQLHLALGALPLALAYAAVRFRPIPAAWTSAGVLAATLAGLVVRAAVIADSPAAHGRSLASVEYYSASWIDLVSRERLHGLERFVFVGWLTPALALVGLAALARRRPPLAVVLALAAVVPLVLALGTTTPLYEPLRAVFPPLRFPRVPERTVPVADLALAALAAFGATALVSRAPPRARRALPAALVALVAADLLVLPLRSNAADPGNRAYARLAKEAQGRVLPLPVLPVGEGHFGSVYDYYQLQAPRERPTGYSTLAPQRALTFPRRFDRLSCGVWRGGDRRALDSLGVRYVVFHTGVYAQSREPGAWFAWRALQRDGYGVLARDGAVSLLARGRGDADPPPVPEPAHTTPVLCQGWLGRTMREREAPLWVWGEGTVVLRIGATAASNGALRAETGRVTRFRAAPGRPASVRVPLSGSRWHLLTVEAGGGPEAIRLLSLRRVP